MFDPNNLTGAQIANVEDLAKQSIATFGDPDYPQTRLIFALAFQKHRMDGGGGTYPAFMAETTLGEAQHMLGVEDDPADDEDTPDDEPADVVTAETPADGSDFSGGPGLLPR